MKRIDRAKSLLLQHQVQALLISDPIDLYYLTGQRVSVGKLLITEGKTTFFVDGRYFEECRTSGLALEDIQSLDSQLQKLSGKCAFDSAHLTYQQVEQLKESKRELLPLPSMLAPFRAVKDPDEIALIKKAAALALKGVEKMVGILSEGISELELARELDYFWKGNGGERFSFDPIIAFGQGSSKPHYHSSKRKLKYGDLVLMDMGVVVDGYASDITRVFAYGKADAELKNIYEIVWQAKEQAIQICRPALSCDAIDQAAREYITSKGYGENFVHSTGHGIGLETHEFPYLRSGNQTAVQENMVFTVEPGIYLPGLGGVRLEDMILVTADGFENLTPAFNSSTLVCL